MTRAPLPGKLPEWPESQVYDLAMMIRRLVRRMDAVVLPLGLCERVHLGPERDRNRGVGDMSKAKKDGVSLQNAEFDAVVELWKQYRRISMTPPVDDDYPEVRHDYDAALNDLLDAAKANNRRMP